MSHCVIIKNEQGKLQGLDLKAQRAYQKWKNLVESLEIGQTLTFSFRMPRSPQHHRMLFAKLQSLLARSETFQDLDKLRYWLVMGAGYADFVPGLDGKPNAIPRSMDFDSMDEADFSELHRCIDNFLWTEIAQRTLWPSLNVDARYQCVESFMREFQ